MKKICTQEELLRHLADGSKTLRESVAVTLGPNGRNVILRRKGGLPLITKDGVTVAKFVELPHEYQDLASQIIKQASISTCNEAGDGTTTATVLADEITQRGVNAILQGKIKSRTLMKRGMESACQAVVSMISEGSVPIRSKEDVENIALISSNGDSEIAEVIAAAVDTAGKAGIITVEKSGEFNTKHEAIEGFKIPSGYASPGFVNRPSLNLVQLDEPAVLITDRPFKTIEEFGSIAGTVLREGRPFVLIADEVSQEILASALVNAQNGAKIAIIKPPRYGAERKEIMQDLAVSLGAKFYDKNTTALEGITLQGMGTCQRMESGATATNFIGGAGTAQDIMKRIEQVRSLMQQTSLEQQLKRQQERITRLSSVASIIYVGGTTEIEVDEKMHRVEDALEAVKSAKEEGILPGGGVVFDYISTRLEEPTDVSESFLEGWRIVRDSLSEPFKQLCKNSDVDLSLLLDEYEGDMQNIKGWNFAEFRMAEISNIEEGIIDPAKVLKRALLNAVSAAGTLLTADTAIVEE